jgi:hypothetical protein
LKHLIDTLNDKWCTPFQQKLEPSKSAIIHFVRGKKTRPEDEIKTALGTIKATSKHRLLGVEIDYKLSFHGHLQNVASKLNRLSGVSYGALERVEIDYKLSFHGHLQNVASKLNRLSGVSYGALEQQAGA